LLIVAPDVLPATFAALRRCGGGERECVAYWLGPSGDSALVDTVLQPPHVGWPDRYEVDSTWVTSFFLDLRTTGQTVRAQVHTHPGAGVRHSPTDDAFALAPSLGFVSLVLPHYATGPISVEGAYVAVVTQAGWAERTPSEVIRWS
jgi:proteasome lid subunit RPN8/RPN11